MIDAETLNKFYGDVPDDHLARFRQFLRTHTIETIEVSGREVSYYSCGQGARTLLTFCGGHSTPYTAWETIVAYESECRVIVIDISGFDTVDRQVEGIDRVLEKEDVERVVLLGPSLAGLVSQIYFKHRFERVDGMILLNTPALKKSDDSSFALVMLRLIPEFVLRALFRRKFRSYYKQAADHPGAESGRRFGLAHLDDIMSNHFTKKKVINLLTLIRQFKREGYRQHDFPGWQGRTLVVASEDDAGFKDAQWLTENLPNAEFHALPKGLGHLPQLVHRDRIEALTRTLLVD
jgi:pimeloyl-ACP methyl ester carboxylesterase